MVIYRETSGMITDIQRFSLHDGPGIRTTVFFKGCNLYCKWCHNPETITLARELHYYSAKCIGCGHCVTVCPTGAQQMTANGHEFDRSLCIVCGKCAAVCYPGAMVMSGREMTAEAVMAEIRQDKTYYDESGGGVTLSGGEVLCQSDFALALTEACHTEGIHIAIETNLASPFEGIKPLLGKVDLVMFDLKIMDAKTHRQWTGMDNRLILENIKKLSAMKVPMIARTPLIPGVTDSDENLAAIAGFLKDVEGIEYYELLNYNPLGEAKYRSLGLTNLFESSRPLGQERLSDIAALLDKTGIPYRLS